MQLCKVPTTTPEVTAKAMKFYLLIWKEMWRRPGPTAIALLVVTLGVSSLVSVESVVSSSEEQVAAQMRQLGANILILPKGVTVQDYHAADSHGRTILEEYVNRVALAQLVGVEELSPKLTVNCHLKGQPVVLTGVLPRTEFYKKSAWQSVDLMTAEINKQSAPASAVGKKHEGCQGRTCHLSVGDKTDLSSYPATRIVHDLDFGAALVGADIAATHGIRAGQKIEMLGSSFRVQGVLPATGTSDDGRVLAHLHRVQELTESGPVVNVIEVMGCCEEAASGLVGEIDQLLPDARVVTISQVVATQVTVNRLMKRLSYALFAIVMAIGGAGIASIMFTNVSERRRELGTLMAIGATPRMVSQMILLKATLIGLIGAGVGLTMGLVAAISMGPYFLNLPIMISAEAATWGFASAILVAVLASYFPARKAASLDPCVCFQAS